MVWKILSFLSAACLGAACFFAWSNQKDLTAERERERFAQANMKAAAERKTQGDEALLAKKTALGSAQKELETTKAETVKLAQDATEKEESLKVVKANLDQIDQQVTAVEKQINEAGDIEKLIAQIEKYKKEQAEAEAGVANQAQRLAAAKQQYESTVAQTTQLREAEARGRRGVVDPAFTARVSQFFPQWHFAILNKGNLGGVFANANLEVKRGKNVIAKLKVMNVEQNGAVAEVIPGSLAKGDVILTGDMVVASATQASTKPEPPSQPPATGGTTPPAPSMDAAAAPMAPATPAAPAMASDPFGAAPAPAPAAAPAAAPAMASDPFGAPPAAPAGTPPAVPAGTPAAPAAPGTPAAPSTADPFGAPPAPKP